MKELKPIINGMIIHVTSEEEYEKVKKYWCSKAKPPFGYWLDYNVYRENTAICLNMTEDHDYSCLIPYSAAIDRGLSVIEFSDLMFIKEGEHMTAEEIVDWIANAYCRYDEKKEWNKVFSGVSLYEVLDCNTSEEIISKIEAYEITKNKKNYN